MAKKTKKVFAKKDFVTLTPYVKRSNAIFIKKTAKKLDVPYSLLLNNVIGLMKSNKISVTALVGK